MHQKIIDVIKKQYTRDLRKQVVKTILKSEKNCDKNELEDSYKTINQIFSYVINELSWSISENNDTWDDAPLKILREVFPKLETTKWFKKQQLSVTKSINVKGLIC
ncbi:MAG: hypothetical protein L3I99_02695 [Sulfurimonas sp.]|nr:hypothetical protein [Sulfurimonas sp.]